VLKSLNAGISTALALAPRPEMREVRDMAEELGHSTSRRLVRAAAVAFSTKGYEGARLSDIADAAGFTTGAVYAHFDGKADLLAAVIAEEGADLFNQVAGRLSDRAPTMQVLRELLMATQAGRHAAVHRVLADAFAVASRDEDVKAALLPELDQIREMLHTLLVRAQLDEEIDPAVPVAALAHFGLTLMVGGVLLRALDSARPPRSDVEVFVEQLVGRFSTAAEPMAPA
jgi:AcrR family transcriptional regulator